MKSEKSHYNKQLKPLARKLRKDSTFGEVILWDKVLKQKQCLGYQFVRQFSVGNFIVDFTCRKLKLAIEIDGYSHNFTVDRDENKTAYLEQIGYKLLRFEESEIKYDINNVIRTIELTINEMEIERGKSPLEKGE